MSRQFFRLFLLITGTMAAMVALSAQAVIYSVNRSFKDVIWISTLTGTVDCPLGTYTIENSGSSPFTAVNLTLTANGGTFHLTSVLTDNIAGTGEFIINATPTALIFNTANADGNNPADLQFTDNWLPPFRNNYAIGSDESPGFESAFVPGADFDSGLSLPVSFGTAVPEPSIGLLGGSVLLGLCCFRTRSNHEPN